MVIGSYIVSQRWDVLRHSVVRMIMEPNVLLALLENDIV